jgi:hypothetical protein
MHTTLPEMLIKWPTVIISVIIIIIIIIIIFRTEQSTERLG